MSVGKSNTALIVSLTQPTAEAMRAGMAAAAEARADMVECRLDCLDDLDRAALRSLLKAPPLPVIATCRPVRQGGQFDRPESDRSGILLAAAKFGAKYVDVEDDLQESWRPKGPLIFSHHDFRGRPTGLDALTALLEAADPAVIKIAFAAAGPEDAIAACGLLRRARRPAIALAMGEHGVMSRVLARKFGAFGTYAALTRGAESAPGQLTIDELRTTYRWDAIGPGTKVYGVIGCPVAHSMSPAIHNAAFAAAGIDAVYVPLRIELGGENFDRFIDAARAAPWMDLAGLSVTIPHKENALAAIGGEKVDELSRRIGAINTIRIDPDARLEGWNTDYAAAIDALCAAMHIGREDLAGRTVAVVGAGGAARAIVAALAHYRAAVAIYNRTVARGEKLAGEFGAAAFGLDAMDDLDAEILINCTSVGMHPNVDETPVAARALSGVGVVFDTIYNPLETRLLREARAAGCTCVSGLDMFVNQAVAQFEIWTGQDAPRQLMREIVIRQLQESDR